MRINVVFAVVLSFSTEIAVMRLSQRHSDAFVMVHRGSMPMTLVHGTRNSSGAGDQF